MVIQLLKVLNAGEVSLGVLNVQALFIHSCLTDTREACDTEFS